MAFSKTEYWKRRSEGKRGQGDFTFTKKGFTYKPQPEKVVKAMKDLKK